MRAHRRHWLWLVLLCGSCFSRCEHAAPDDLGVQTPLDFAVGELGRPAGNACTTVDNCNRVVADTCAGLCQCGSEHPCDGDLTCCNGRCVDALTDPQNCGGCGIACAGGQCVHGDGGAPHCTCDVDAGGDCSSASAYEPSCNGEGLCTCGPSSQGVCNSLNADSCSASGCRCAGGPACGGQLVDHCNPGHGCQCGAEPACDPALATGCDPTQSGNPCRCAQGPGCAPGTFCCTQNSTCCSPSQYCCLNGCCAHPCLLFGFCDH
jgi:hypothetical protein